MSWRAVALALVAACGTLWLASPAGAQDWDDLYERAVASIEAALERNAQAEDPVWAEARGLLEQAIALRPEPQTGRFGMLVARRKKYFPHFYRGVTQLRSGRYEEAGESLGRARQFGAVLEDGKLGAEFLEWEALLSYRLGSDQLEQGMLAEALQNLEAAEKSGRLAAEHRDELAGRLEEARRRLAQRTSRFEGLASSAESHLEAGRYGAALRDLEEAERFDRGQFEQRGLGELQQRARDRQVDVLLAEVKAGGSPSEIQSKLKQALAIRPGRPDVQQALRSIIGEYPSLRARGDEAREAGDWAAALGPYRRALLFFPGDAARDRLGPRLESVTRSLLREAVADLCSGRVDAAAGVLEQAVEAGADEASVYAYLGVAYARAAFRSLEESAVREFRDKALEQFRRAHRLAPDYELPARLVSPLILQLFQQAAGEG